MQLPAAQYFPEEQRVKENELVWLLGPPLQKTLTRIDTWLREALQKAVSPGTTSLALIVPSQEDVKGVVTFADGHVRKLDLMTRIPLKKHHQPLHIAWTGQQPFRPFIHVREHIRRALDMLADLHQAVHQPRIHTPTLLNMLNDLFSILYLAKQPVESRAGGGITLGEVWTSTMAGWLPGAELPAGWHISWSLDVDGELALNIGEKASPQTQTLIKVMHPVWAEVLNRVTDAQNLAEIWNHKIQLLYDSL